MVSVLLLLLLVAGTTPASASILEYIWPTDENADSSTAVDTFPSVPYELSDGEESFIREASKWIGMNLSKLDICHHRIILKLKKSCHELNAEQMGKLAVMLLNCQSDSEGRPVFPCTDEISLRQCTERMDPNTWNAYHLITNRAKAVCASVRHEQFRGLTELTVNKLMTTAHGQVRMMDELAESQQKLQTITKQAMDAMEDNNERIMHQQGDIMQLSEVHRAKVESNFRELARGKDLIKAGQQEVAVLLTDLRRRIDDSMQQLEVQSQRSKLDHDALLSDLERLQANAAEIAAKIEETGVHFTQHHRAVEDQFRYTLEQVQRINATVASMLESIRTLQQDFNRHLSWLVEKIGGSEKILPKLNVILVHLGYLLLGMICLAFVGSDKVLRVVLVVAVPGNLIGGLLELFEPDVVRLSVGLGCVAVVDVLAHSVMKIMSVRDASKAEETTTHSQERPAEHRAPNGRTPSTEESDEEELLPLRTRRKKYHKGTVDQFHRGRFRSTYDDFRRRSVTPREGSYTERQHCTATTLRGDRCRGFALAGTEFCRLHEPRGL
uniref:Protein brambleberry n=1 Tax=Anopheles stephensi TaxID=30069 RepID=A0A182YMB5_ANOST